MPALYPKEREAAPWGSANSPLSGRYELDGVAVPSVTEVIHDVGLGMDTRGIDPEVLANKGRIGTIVHDEIARILTGEEGFRLYEDRVMAYLFSWRQWFREVDPFDVVACEVSYVPNLRIAGTMDLLARRRRDRCWILYDWKTRDPKPYDGLQLAGYLGLAVLHPDIPYGLEDLRNTKRVIVSLREWEPAREREYDDLLHDFEVFDAACTVWHARRTKR